MPAPGHRLLLLYPLPTDSLFELPVVKDHRLSSSGDLVVFIQRLSVLLLTLGKAQNPHLVLHCCFYSGSGHLSTTFTLAKCARTPLLPLSHAFVSRFLPVVCSSELPLRCFHFHYISVSPFGPDRAGTSSVIQAGLELRRSGCLCS